MKHNEMSFKITELQRITKKRRCHEYKCVLGKKICKSFWRFKMKMDLRH